MTRGGCPVAVGARVSKASRAWGAAIRQGDTSMRTIKFASLSAAIALASCGGGVSEEAKAAAAPAGPHATAVTRKFSVMMDKLEVDEHKYVDGIAIKVPGGAAALLSVTPLDACMKLAVGARAEPSYSVLGSDGKPSLVIVKDEEHPKGAALATQPYMTETLEEELPGLAVDGAKFVFKADVGDAGWGQIDATKYGGTNSAHVSVDIDLPYATVPPVDPAADTGEEGKWLRDLREQADKSTDPNDTQALVVGSTAIPEGDYTSERDWFDVLSNWKRTKVVAVARDKDCATLVVGAQSFTDKPVQAIVHTRMVDGQRKAVGVVTIGDD